MKGIRPLDVVTRNYEIVYDFHSKHFLRDVKRIKYGDGLNFKVINFPRFVYDAKMDYQIVRLQTESNKNNLQDLFGLSNTKAPSDLKNDSVRISNNSQALYKSLQDKIQITIDSLNTIATKPVNLPFKRAIQDTITILQNIKSAIDTIKILDSTGKHTSVDIDRSFKNQKYLLPYYNRYNQYNQQKNLVNRIRTFYTIIKYIDDKSRMYTQLSKDLNAIKYENSTFNTVIKKAKEILDLSNLNFDDDIRGLPKLIDSLKDEYKSIKSILHSEIIATNSNKLLSDGVDPDRIENDLEDDFSRINTAKYNEAIGSIKSLYKEVINPANYSINFGKIMAYGDEIEMNFEHIPKDQVTGNIERDYTFPKIIGIYNYWNFDVSTCLLGTSVINEKVYNVISTGNDSVIISQKNKKFNMNIGFAAFLQVSYVCSPVVRVGLGVGGGVTTGSNLSGAFFIGPSIGFRVGRKVLMSFNTGVSFSMSSVLKEKYVDGIKYISSYVEESYTENRLRPGFYGGIAFNLISVQLNKKN
jgi:hypothetical protein